MDTQDEIEDGALRVVPATTATTTTGAASAAAASAAMSSSAHHKPSSLDSSLHRAYHQPNNTLLAIESTRRPGASEASLPSSSYTFVLAPHQPLPHASPTPHAISPVPIASTAPYKPPASSVVRSLVFAAPSNASMSFSSGTYVPAATASPSPAPCGYPAPSHSLPPPYRPTPTSGDSYYDPRDAIDAEYDEDYSLASACESTSTMAASIDYAPTAPATTTTTTSTTTTSSSTTRSTPQGRAPSSKAPSRRSSKSTPTRRAPRKAASSSRSSTSSSTSSSSPEGLNESVECLQQLYEQLRSPPKVSADLQQLPAIRQVMGSLSGLRSDVTLFEYQKVISLSLSLSLSLSRAFDLDGVQSVHGSIDCVSYCSVRWRG